jgi:hypothetical protein
VLHGVGDDEDGVEAMADGAGRVSSTGPRHPAERRLASLPRAGVKVFKAGKTAVFTALDRSAITDEIDRRRAFIPAEAGSRSEHGASLSRPGLLSPVDLDGDLSSDMGVALGDDGRGGVGQREHLPDGEAQRAEIDEAGQFNQLIPAGFHDEVHSTDTVGRGVVGRWFVGDADQDAAGP